MHIYLHVYICIYEGQYINVHLYLCIYIYMCVYINNLLNRLYTRKSKGSFIGRARQKVEWDNDYIINYKVLNLL